MLNRYSRIILLILSSLIIALLFTLALIGKPNYYVDDAWISYRYAHNIAYHASPTFNLSERVEGITNILWAVLLGASGRLFNIPIEVAAQYLALLLLLLVLYRIWNIGLLLEIHPLIAVLPAAMLVMTPNYFATANNGLEVPLLTFLLVESIYWLIRGKYLITALCTGLLFLTRPETLAFGMLIGVVLVTEYFFKNKQRMILIGLVFYLGLIMMFTAFRIYFYNDFIPNSVRAKWVPLQMEMFSNGVKYVLDFLTLNPHLLIVLSVGIFLLILAFLQDGFGSKTIAQFLEPVNQMAVITLAMILFSFVVAIRNGGDWMGHHRLLAQYTALYSLLFLANLRNRGLNAIVGVAILMAPFIQTCGLAFQRLQQDAPIQIINPAIKMDGFYTSASERLAGMLDPDDTLSAEGLGYISYRLIDYYFHDPAGLTNRHLARKGQPRVPFGKMDIDYTIRKVKPTVLLWHHAGHLRGYNPGYLDKHYVFYCYASCSSWDAKIMMIERDRSADIAEKFKDWSQFTIASLYETTP